MAGANDASMQKEIGLRIARLRDKHKWSQERLALEAEVKSSQISAIENGNALPKITTVSRICAALGCSYEDIIPTCPGMRVGLNPAVAELSRILEDLTAEQSDQIINTALAAAKYYADEPKQ